MVAALVPMTSSRISGARLRCPCRSIASTSSGAIARNRFPQTRSDASQSISIASRAASPYNVGRGRRRACASPTPRTTRTACLRGNPVTAVNSFRIALFSARLDDAWRSETALAKSLRVAILNCLTFILAPPNFR